MRQNILSFFFLFATIGFLMMYVLSNSNKTLATIESSANSSMSDVFGIRKIYETKPGGFEWYMNMDDPEEDPHLYNYDDMQENNDNSYNIGDRSRMSVYSEDGVGYEEGSMKTYDFSELSSRGYWYKQVTGKMSKLQGNIFTKKEMVLE